MKVKPWIKLELNKEKIKIIEYDENTFVTANSETKKTLLPTFKYLNL